MVKVLQLSFSDMRYSHDCGNPNNRMQPFKAFRVSNEFLNAFHLQHGN